MKTGIPLAAAVLALGLLVANCTNSLSGGTEIGNPTRVSGTVRDSTGASVSGAMVYLLPAGFNPVSPRASSAVGMVCSGNALPDTLLADTTDTNGAFRIEGVPSGTYTVNGWHAKSGTRALLDSIKVGMSVLDIGTIALKRTGSIVVSVGDSAFKPGSYIYIRGTDVFTRVDSAGAVRITVPAGTVDVLYYSTGASAYEQSPIARNVTVSSGQTVQIGKSPSPVRTPLRPWVWGPDTIDAGDTTFFATAPGTRPAGGLVLQFDWGDGGRSAWLSDTFAGHAWTQPGAFPVSVRARSRADTTRVSGWSDSALVWVRSTLNPVVRVYIEPGWLMPDSQKANPLSELILDTSCSAPVVAVYRAPSGKLLGISDSAYWRCSDTSVAHLTGGPGDGRTTVSCASYNARGTATVWVMTFAGLSDSLTVLVRPDTLRTVPDSSVAAPPGNRADSSGASR